MIKSLHVENLQRHKNVTINFSKGVNYIVGESGCGKSSIIRGLRWVLRNKPSNTTMVRRKSKGLTLSEITLWNGQMLRRTRGKSENSYYLNGVAKSGFGKDIPIEIIESIPFNEDIAFQRQGDSFFLIGLKSSSDRAKELDRMLELSSISTAMHRARKQLLADTKTVDGIKAVLQQAREERDGLKSKMPDSLTLDALREEGAIFTRLTSELAILTKNNSIIQSLRTRKRELQPVCKADFDSLSDSLSELRDGKKALSLLLQARGHRESLSATREVREALAELETLYNTFNAEFLLYRDIASKYFYLMETDRKLYLLGVELKGVEKQCKQNVCPTCGRKL